MMEPDRLTMIRQWSAAEARMLQRPPSIPPMGAFSHDDLAVFGARIMDVVQLSAQGVLEIRWQREEGTFCAAVRTHRHKKHCACGRCPKGGQRRHLIKASNLAVAVERAFRWLTTMNVRVDRDDSADPYPPQHEYMVKP